MAPLLSDTSKALLSKPVFANIATVNDRCEPQLTPVWIDFEGDDILFNTAEGRTKAVNLRKHPDLAISVVDPADPYNSVLIVRGKAIEITEEGADEHIDALAQKYLGRTPYPFRQPGEKRLKVRVRIEKVVSEPSPPSS